MASAIDACTTPPSTMTTIATTTTSTTTTTTTTMTTTATSLDNAEHAHLEQSRESSLFFGEVTRSTASPYRALETPPNYQAIRHALRTESAAIFVHLAPLLEYARDMFDVARAVITIFRKDKLELYHGSHVSTDLPADRV
jgi:hypothetical protein